MSWIKLHIRTNWQLHNRDLVLNTIGMLDKFLREQGKHIIAVIFRTNWQLYNCDLVRAEGY